MTVKQRESYHKEPDTENTDKEAFFRDVVDSADRLQILRLIYDLYQDGKKAPEIAYHIPQTKQFINQIIAAINITPKETHIDRFLARVDANLRVK